jgi:hypothetical protein
MQKSKEIDLECVEKRTKKKPSQEKAESESIRIRSICVRWWEENLTSAKKKNTKHGNGATGVPATRPTRATLTTLAPNATASAFVALFVDFLFVFFFVGCCCRANGGGRKEEEEEERRFRRREAADANF